MSLSIIQFLFILQSKFLSKTLFQLRANSTNSHSGILIHLYLIHENLIIISFAIQVLFLSLSKFYLFFLLDLESHILKCAFLLQNFLFFLYFIKSSLQFPNFSILKIPLLFTIHFDKLFIHFRKLFSYFWSLLYDFSTTYLLNLSFCVNKLNHVQKFLILIFLFLN